MRDETKNATKVEIAAGNSMQVTSKVDVGSHLSEQEVITDAFSKNDANTQKVERVKIGSNKICLPEDLVADKIGVRQRVQPCRFAKWAMWSSLS